MAKWPSQSFVYIFLFQKTTGSPLGIYARVKALKLVLRISYSENFWKIPSKNRDRINFSKRNKVTEIHLGIFQRLTEQFLFGSPVTGGGGLSFICVCKNIVPYALLLYTLFYKQRFFSTLPQCCLAFSWIDFQMLLRYCLIHIRCWLIHITIIILEHFLYLFYLDPCLDLRLFRPYLCYLFFIFIFIVIIINRIIWLKQTQMFFCLFFRIFPFIFGWYHGWRMWIISK